MPFAERDGSMITHETRIREVPGSNPLAGHEVFSGFLNLKIAKELVIFKEKSRVGPHIPLLMIKVQCFSRSETTVVKNGGLLMFKFSNRWR